MPCMGKCHVALVNKALVAPGQFTHNAVKDCELSRVTGGASS